MMDAVPEAAVDFARLGPPPGTRCAVVGGCGGIGRALVEALMDTGVTTAVLDLAVSLDRHPTPDGVLDVPIDATDDTSVADAFFVLKQEWGGLDCLINLCGFTIEHLKIGDLSDSQWDEGVNGNLKAAVLVSKHGAPMVEQSGGGTIVHMSSGLGSVGGFGYGPYSASKAAVMSLTKSLAHEYAPKVRANAVAPGAVDTAFLHGGTGRSDETPKDTRFSMDEYIKRVPLGRIGHPDDIVGPMLFLAGPASAHITGQVLHINGGALMP